MGLAAPLQCGYWVPPPLCVSALLTQRTPAASGGTRVAPAGSVSKRVVACCVARCVVARLPRSVSEYIIVYLIDAVFDRQCLILGLLAIPGTPRDSLSTFEVGPYNSALIDDVIYIGRSINVAH